MITITIPSQDFFNEETGEFGHIDEKKISLEHSLLSIRKWEGKWHKPFLSSADKTPEELIDYLRCMTLTQNVDPKIYYLIPQDEFERVVNYINDPMSATTIRKDPTGPKSRSIITAELLYYDMIALQIPFECEKWHLNQLLMLIDVCSEKNKPHKKMNKKDLMSRNRNLNAARKRKLGTHG